MTATDVYLDGIAETDVGVVPDRTADELITAASVHALADAGRGVAEVDALIAIVPRSRPRVWFAESVAQTLGIRAQVLQSLPQGGSAVVGALARARRLLSTGHARCVLIAGADSLASGMGRSAVVASLAESGFGPYESPYGPTVPAAFALMAQRHMADYGTSPEQLAEVAVTMRRHAGLTDRAQQRTPITVADVLASRPIAEPLRLLHCSQISDGGAALVLSAEPGGGDHGAVQLLGAQVSHAPTNILASENVARCEPCRDAAGEALAQAGVAITDIDVLLLYDPFAIAVIMALEDIGVCPRGEGGAFVSSGGIELGGALPVNPHGGLLSYAHPGRPAALLHVVEAVRQLRGQAGQRQVAGARLALFAAEGAMLGGYGAAVFAGSPLRSVQ